MHLTAEDQAKFANQYVDPNLTMKDLVGIWKAPSGTLYRWGFELGLNRPKPKGEIALALDHVRQYCEQVSKEMPPLDFKLKPFKFKHSGRVMELVLFLCDLHPARLTISYNSEVFSHRMLALSTRLQEHTVMLKQCYTVKTLHTFALGDFEVGEALGRNITLEELEHTVLDQVYKLAIPELVLFSNRIALWFDDVYVHAVKGNHGVIDKRGPSQAANWDNVVYLGWEARMANLRKFHFNIELVKWYNYAEVMGLEWLLVHGDQVKASGGNPYNGLVAKSQRWHISMPQPFDDIASGHFHQFIKAGDWWLGPTLLSDDDWSREVLGKEGECGQLLLGITEQGIEYVSPIGLGDIT